MVTAGITLIAGIIFGIALAAPPGPMNAIIAEESVLRGWSAGFYAGLGAMFADVIFFLLAVIGVVSFVRDFPLLRSVMSGIGGVLMIYFAMGAVSELRYDFRMDPEQSPAAADDIDTHANCGASQNSHTGFLKAFILALSNPYQILFWLTIGVGLLQSGQFDILAQTPYVGNQLAGILIVETGSPALLVGLFGGITVWITGFPAALARARRQSTLLGPTITVLSAIVLVGFGILFLTRSVTQLFPVVDSVI